ncbi:glycosyltransferase family 2 protein [Phormidium tenue]|uniref:Glycosyl transferase n=1 Tax=Phormidium tenue NIES-30 TaxID=549789 RepID=A0A1U7J685_9CYAN|nr:glycosyltransferase family 2 protein [Phormidium tenue]MBD2232055.1 glycosyltransferase [Phormidium tenue FACHB-1052]OKH48356.1 glycosyl transferase [Phormidium tenue NIES-30]
MTLTFSVITPSYNQGQFIERTIQSILSQTAVEFDYMVCDGGSKDETIKVLKKYQAHLRWVSEPDGGQADAVNRGIRSTQGDIIAWINSDDIYYPGAFKKVQNVFLSHPEVSVVYGNANHIDREDGYIEPYPTEPWNYNRLKEICFLCQPAVFFRRQMVNDYGDLDASLKFCMDYELWLRYGKQGSFFYLPDLLAGSRFYQDTKTLGQRVAVHYEINEMLKAKLLRSPERWVLAYASVLAEEEEKSQGRDSNNLWVQVQRVNTFFFEAFRGYRRWRNFAVSPSTAWQILRWTVAAYYRFLKSKVLL